MDIIEPGVRQLLAVVHAHDAMRFGFGFRQGRQQHRGKYCDDGNDDQKFDQGERAIPSLCSLRPAQRVTTSRLSIRRHGVVTANNSLRPYHRVCKFYLKRRQTTIDNLPHDVRQPATRYYDALSCFSHSSKITMRNYKSVEVVPPPTTSNGTVHRPGEI